MLPKIIFAFSLWGIFCWLVLRRPKENKKKAKKSKGEIERERVKNAIENMDFYEVYEYALKRQNGKDKKMQRQLICSLLITFLLAVIVKTIFKTHGYNIDIWTLVILIGLLSMVWVVMVVAIALLNSDFSSEDIREKLLFSFAGLRRQLMQEHGYTFEKGRLDIQDTEIGLMSGDQRKNYITSVECDEFTYEKIRYYYEKISEDENGNEHTEEITTFIGFELFFPYSTSINEPVRIVPSVTKMGKEKIFKVMSKGRLEGEEHVDIEDIEFNENFEVFSKDPHSAYYFLDSKKIEALKELRRKNIISAVVDKDGLYIATNREMSLMDLPPVNINEDISKERFERDFEEFEKVLGEYKKIIE